MGGDALINRFKLYIYGLNHVNASITYTRTPEILRFYLKKVSFESYAVSGCHIYKKLLYRDSHMVIISSGAKDT